MEKKVRGRTQRMKSCRRVAVSRPMLMPRKHASRTMLVKNVRKTTVLPNQRMHANSKNRIRKLIRNRSRYGRRGESMRGCDSAPSVGTSITGNAVDSIVVVMRRGIVMRRDRMKTGDRYG